MKPDLTGLTYEQVQYVDSLLVSLNSQTTQTVYLEDELRIADACIARQKKLLERALSKVRLQHQDILNLSKYDITTVKALCASQNGISPA